jgi:RNA polymerase sigma-70 factor, ECF subfamily
MAMKQIPDALLIKNYINGDEDALAVLVKRHQSKIYGFIFSKVQDRDVTNDIFQDTFVKVIKNLKGNGYNEKGKFFSWVICIAHNLISDYFRDNKRVKIQRDLTNFPVLSLIKNEELNIEEKLVWNQIEKDILSILNELPEQLKEIVELRFFQELSYKEISEKTGVSVNTALARMRYAVMGMRRIIKKNKIILE